METVSVDVTCDGACSYQSNNGSTSFRITLDNNEVERIQEGEEQGSEANVIQNEVTSENSGDLPPQDDVMPDEDTNDIGTTNPVYSPDQIDNALPLLSNISKRNSYVYPVIVPDIEIHCNNRDGENNGTENTSAKRSTSMPDLASRIIIAQRKCSCDCHCDGLDNPSFDHRHPNNPNTLPKNHLPSTPPQHNFGVSYILPNMVLDIDSRRNTPGNTPGRVRRYLPSQMAKMFDASSSSGGVGSTSGGGGGGGSISSGGMSSISSKAPPNYRSLIFAILKDEPPRYEDVTGKKLSDDLVNATNQNASLGRPPNLMSCVTGFAIFIGVVIITSMLFYIIDSHFHIFTGPDHQKKPYFHRKTNLLG